MSGGQQRTVEDIGSLKSMQLASSLESQMSGILVPSLAKKAMIGSIRGGLEEIKNQTIRRSSITGNLGGTLGSTLTNMPKFKDILG